MTAGAGKPSVNSIRDEEARERDLVERGRQNERDEVIDFLEDEADRCPIGSMRRTFLLELVHQLGRVAGRVP